MIGLRQAINQIPSWPGFVLAGLVVIGLVSWYYGTRYQACNEVRQARELLRQAIDRVASGGDGNVLDMAREIPGDWDEVRIVEAYDPGRVPLDCPFGWDLSASQRQALIEAGKYTIIGLFRSGEFRGYIEYSGDLAGFDNPPQSIARGQARFRVGGASTPYELSLIR